MSNRIYLWGEKSSQSNEFANNISFTSDELMLKVRFGDFAQFMSMRREAISYEDVLFSDEALSLIEKILDSFQRDSERTFFTVDVSSRSYLKMMSFFESVAFKDVSFPKEKRFMALDSLFDSIDEKVAMNFPNISNDSYQQLSNAILDAVRSVATDKVEAVRRNLEISDRTKMLQDMMLSDLFYDMSMLMVWLVNHTKHIRKESAFRIVICSDIEKAMQTIIGVVQRNKSIDFGGSVVLDHAMDTEISNAITLFFTIISNLLHSVLNRDNSDKNMSPLQMEKENVLLSHLWKAIQKEGSIWMTSPVTNKKLMGYL
jgi:hypothetical protein